MSSSPNASSVAVAHEDGVTHRQGGDEVVVDVGGDNGGVDLGQDDNYTSSQQQQQQHQHQQQNAELFGIDMNSVTAAVGSQVCTSL